MLLSFSYVAIVCALPLVFLENSLLTYLYYINSHVKGKKTFLYVSMVRVLLLVLLKVSLLTYQLNIQPFINIICGDLTDNYIKIRIINSSEELEFRTR